MKLTRRTSAGSRPALVGDEVHQPFQIEGGLRASGAPVRAIRARIRVDPFDDIVQIRNLVRAGRHHPGAPGEIQRLGIGAGIEQDAPAQCLDATVPVGPDLELAPLVAAVIGGQEVLAARLDPLHRPLQLERQRRGDEVLVIGTELAAEPAADFRRDGAYLVLTQTEGAGDLVAEAVWPLVRGPDGESARDRVWRGEDTPGLHRHGMATRGANLGLHFDRARLASAASTSP